MKLHLCQILLLANLSVGLSSSFSSMQADVDEDIDTDVERMMRNRKKRKTTTSSPVTEPDQIKRFTRSYLTIVGDQVTSLETTAGVSVSDDIPFDVVAVRENKLGSASFARGKLSSSAGVSSQNQVTNFSVRGSSFLQDGPIYNPNDVKFIDCNKQPDKDSCEQALCTGRDVVFDPSSDAGDPPISFNLNFPLRYGGGKQPNVQDLRPPRKNYFFNGECTTVAGFGASQILAHSCFYNLCLGGLGEDCVNIYAGGGYIFDPFKVLSPGEEPIIPPSFPGAVIGGTGKYQGIKGTAQIVTITTRTGANLQKNFNFNEGFNPVLTSGSAQTGYLTQLIQLETSINLPPSLTQPSE